MLPAISICICIYLIYKLVQGIDSVLYCCSLVFVFGLHGICICSCICIYLIYKNVPLCIRAPWYLYSSSHPGRDNQCWHCVSKLCPCSSCLEQESNKKMRPNLGICPDQPWHFYFTQVKIMCILAKVAFCSSLSQFSFTFIVFVFFLAAENNQGHCVSGPAFLQATHTTQRNSCKSGNTCNLSESTHIPRRPYFFLFRWNISV